MFGNKKKVADLESRVEALEKNVLVLNRAVLPGVIKELAKNIEKNIEKVFEKKTDRTFDNSKAPSADDTVALGKEMAKRRPCKKCGKVCKNGTGLASHMRAAHK